MIVIRTLSAPAASFQGAVLTDKPGATGHVFPPERIPRDQSWRALMEFRLTAPPGQAGADGIAVFFASEQKQGLGGYGLGYSGIGTTGDFAVEGQLVLNIRTQDSQQWIRSALMISPPIQRYPIFRCTHHLTRITNTRWRVLKRALYLASMMAEFSLWT